MTIKEFFDKWKVQVKFWAEVKLGIRADYFSKRVQPDHPKGLSKAQKVALLKYLEDYEADLKETIEVLKSEIGD